MIIVWDQSKKFRAKLAAELGEHVEVEHAGSAEEARGAFGPDGVGVLLVGPSVDARQALEIAHDLQNTSPGVGVVLMRTKPSAALMRAAMRAGVRDVIPPAATAEQLRGALRNAGATTRTTSNGSLPPGRVITVFSAKGGCGKSFLASNLAVLLADQHPGKVALVDLDFDSGDQEIMLQLFGGQNFLDVVADLDRLDGDALRTGMPEHSSGVHLLAAPTEPGMGEKIDPADVQRVLGMLRSVFRFVIVDGPTTYTEHLLAALDASDECLLIASLEVPAIRSLKVSLQTLDALSFDRNRIRVILNRADSQVGLRPAEVEKAIGREVDVHVPSSRDVPLSINRGSPLASSGPRSKVMAPISELAQMLSGGRPPTAGRRARRSKKERTA